MIPIVSHGRIVGFGGRTIDNHPAKYINSKTSVLYDKSNVLFGLWQARREIEKCNMAIIVEGYFDVMGLASHNLRIVVSPCGTAFTKGQADLLRRYTNRVLVLFDGDPEGRKAAKRAKKILVSSKIYRGRVFLPNGYDPDDFVEQFGVKSISKLKIRR
jgi:DNA primase